jgi:hypothetical protein
MKKPFWKILLLILVIIEIPLISYLAVEWTKLHGFFEGIWFWYINGAADPIYLAAEIDFLALIAIVGLLLLRDWRQLGGKIDALFCAWALLYFVFPSLGIALYLLWLRDRLTRKAPASDF